MKIKHTPIEIYSDVCFNVSIRRKCKLCRNEYNRNQKRSLKKKVADELRKTRSFTIQKRLKYADVCCNECKDKTSYNCLCELCKKQYKKTQVKLSRKNK